MVRVVFFVENGIGFGHIRRVTLVAEELRRVDHNIDIVIISQAHSMLMLKETPFKIINLPFVYRLPDNTTEAFYRSFLNNLLQELQPELVVEDTYPSDWIGALPSLANVPKILLFRRITGYDFNTMRLSGVFSRFAKIIMMQDSDDFLQERNTYESETLALFAHTFEFAGPVYYHPKLDELTHIRQTYAPDGASLVVINAGAGGEQLHFQDTEYCEQLFDAMEHVAHKLRLLGSTARFVFVTGPYYEGTRVTSLPNCVYIRYEPLLPALLAIAKVAVLRPGFNVTHEALSGSASLILVPHISYMEGQTMWVDRLKQRYPNRINIGTYNNIDQLIALTQHGLNTSIVEQDAIHSGQTAAAHSIKNVLNQSVNLYGRLAGEEIVLFVSKLNPQLTNIFYETLAPISQNFVFVGQAPLNSSVSYLLHDLDTLQTINTRTSSVFLQASHPYPLSRDELVQNGIRFAFFTSRSNFGMSAKQWCKQYPLRGYGILDIEIAHFELRANWQCQLVYLIKRILETIKFPSVYLDLSSVQDEATLRSLAEEFASWISTTQCSIVSFDKLLDYHTRINFMGRRQDSDVNWEIDKLL